MKCVQNGFTLVEVIVVLVVLAVLAAILVPSLSGYIDKANDRAAIAECRACVQATQLLLSESYAGDDLKVSVADTKALAEVEGDITRIDYNRSAKVEHLAYRSSDKVRVVYCAAAGKDGCGNSETYTIGGAVPAGDGLVYLEGAPVPGAFLGEAISGGTEFKSGSVDSTTVYKEGANAARSTEKVLKYFAENGVDIGDFNIQSWAIRKENNSKDTPSIMIWSDQDISKCEVGEDVKVIRFDSISKTYEAGYVKIKKHRVDGGPWYNIFDIDTERPASWKSLVDNSSQNYGEILNYYNTMTLPEGGA